MFLGLPIVVELVHFFQNIKLKKQKRSDAEHMKVMKENRNYPAVCYGEETRYGFSRRCGYNQIGSCFSSPSTNAHSKRVILSDCNTPLKKRLPNFSLRAWGLQHSDILYRQSGQQSRRACRKWSCSDIETQHTKDTPRRDEKSKLDNGFETKDGT